MAKHIHEVRDPIHTFVRFETDERRVMDSRPFQRLRHIHQLALTHLVYPGATHRRFEHSLGVMELAGRVYDIVTDPEHIAHDEVRDIVPKSNSFDHKYWRRVVRMAALCHDIGHLPYSHAGEDLLPDKKKHEHLTVALIESDYLRQIWSDLNIKPSDIARLAVGPSKYTGTVFSDWEVILSEIIIGDAFGVDRIDYLLRDSHHTGVAYGKFDHVRLIDNLRILPKSYADSLRIELRHRRWRTACRRSAVDRAIFHVYAGLFSPGSKDLRPPSCHVLQVGSCQWKVLSRSRTASAAD